MLGSNPAGTAAFPRGYLKYVFNPSLDDWVILPTDSQGALGICQSGASSKETWTSPT
jgi:hypothetical protein